MNDFMIWTIIVAILAIAITYIIIQKRNGVKCIGCPSESQCSCTKEPTTQCACQVDTGQSNHCNKNLISTN